MMDQKNMALLHLSTVLLLCFSSCLLSLQAAPQSRSLALRNQGAPELKVVTREMPIEKEWFVEGRMDFESNDYPGSGPNHHHDPKSPGKP